MGPCCVGGLGPYWGVIGSTLDKSSAIALFKAFKLGSQSSRPPHGLDAVPEVHAFRIHGRSEGLLLQRRVFLVTCWRFKHTYVCIKFYLHLSSCVFIAILLFVGGRERERVTETNRKRERERERDRERASERERERERERDKERVRGRCKERGRERSVCVCI